MDLESFNQSQYETNTNIDYALALTRQMMEQQVILTQMFSNKKAWFDQEESTTIILRMIQ